MLISRTSSTARSVLFWVADLCLFPFVLIAAVPFRVFRRIGAHRLPISRQLFRKVGIWPLHRHYYDPLIDPRDLSQSLQTKRALPGIEWNVDEQLSVLAKMQFRHELEEFLGEKSHDELRFSYHNESFLSGDADYLYSFVRLKKPRRVIEIGCGNSTLLIVAAIAHNRQDDASYECDHVCVEPYEQPWLERLGIQVLRQRVENIGIERFAELGENDLLFIDSSHIIRPCGDVVFQILEILPTLRPGVVVHIHDIFTPANYLTEWVVDRGYQWNEQYLLEAFLSQNRQYKVVGALNFLHHNYYSNLERICAIHSRSREPGSFYIQRV
jgi:predicted O-methyltransferase YrrM